MIGTGPHEEALRALATRNANDVSRLPRRATVNALVGNARAAILPGEEDFGLVPLEAAAAGTPTIALRAGGALETIVEGAPVHFSTNPTMHRSPRRSRHSIAARYEPAMLRAHAETFAPPRFIERLRALVDQTREERGVRRARVRCDRAPAKRAPACRA